MRPILTLMIFSAAMAACVGTQVEIRRDADIDIQQNPCRLVATADGRVVFSMDGTEYGIACPVEVE